MTTGYFGQMVQGAQVNYNPEPAATSEPGMLSSTGGLDGTAVKVVTISVAAAIGLYAMRHIAGIRFNVGVSG